MQLSPSQHARPIRRWPCSVAKGSVTHWKSFGSWSRPKVIRTPHTGNSFVGAGLGTALGCSVGSIVGAVVGTGDGKGVGSREGFGVGSGVGLWLGAGDGSGEGLGTGTGVGSRDGIDVGAGVGRGVLRGMTLAPRRRECASDAATTVRASAPDSEPSRAPGWVAASARG